MSSNDSDISGILEKYYRNYGYRARELKSQGHKIIGYLCSYVPVEIITAAGLIPFRLRGDIKEPITKGDSQMEVITCSMVRSCFDVSLKGRYDFIDGIVVPHACDSICRSYDIWRNALDLPFSHLFNVPHSTDDSSLEFFKAVIATFKISLERFTGVKISNEALERSIRLYNDLRSAVKELYELRKPDPPLSSGTEVTQALVTISSIPVDEGISLLNGLIDEVKRRDRKDVRRPRLMVVSSQIDHVNFIQLIEDIGATVVVDDLCPGARDYWLMVDVTDNPIDGLTERYLRKIVCSRTFREKKGDYADYLEDRFGHISQMARDFKVDGLVLLVYRYCDPFGFEVPQLRSYLESKQIPVLYIEDEYSMLSEARLRNRIQAFLESIESSL